MKLTAPKSVAEYRSIAMVLEAPLTRGGPGAQPPAWLRPGRGAGGRGLYPSFYEVPHRLCGPRSMKRGRVCVRRRHRGRSLFGAKSPF